MLPNIVAFGHLIYMMYKCGGHSAEVEKLI